MENYYFLTCQGTEMGGSQTNCVRSTIGETELLHTTSLFVYKVCWKNCQDCRSPPLQRIYLLLRWAFFIPILNFVTDLTLFCLHTFRMKMKINRWLKSKIILGWCKWYGLFKTHQPVHFILMDARVVYSGVCWICFVYSVLYQALICIKIAS